MRLTLVMLAILGVFTTPWLSLVAVLILSLLYRAYEVLLIGLLFDFLWLPLGSPLTFVPWATIIAICVVMLAEPLRNEFLIS